MDNYNNKKPVSKKIILSVGDTAPNIKAKLQNGQDFDLEKSLQNNKKVLLIFYPGDDTPGCTKQLCGVRDIYSEYQELGVEVYGVNHADLASHQKFIDKFSFPFDLIIDENKEISKAYGAMTKFFRNDIIKRGAFLIGEDRKIKFSTWGQQDNQKIISLLKNSQT